MSPLWVVAPDSLAFCRRSFARESNSLDSGRRRFSAGLWTVWASQTRVALGALGHSPTVPLRCPRALSLLQAWTGRCCVSPRGTFIFCLHSTNPGKRVPRDCAVPVPCGFRRKVPRSSVHAPEPDCPGPRPGRVTSGPLLSLSVPPLPHRRDGTS